MRYVVTCLLCLEYHTKFSYCVGIADLCSFVGAVCFELKHRNSSPLVSLCDISLRKSQIPLRTYYIVPPKHYTLHLYHISLLISPVQTPRHVNQIQNRLSVMYPLQMASSQRHGTFTSQMRRRKHGRRSIVHGNSVPLHRTWPNSATTPTTSSTCRSTHSAGLSRTPFCKVEAMFSTTSHWT